MWVEEHTENYNLLSSENSLLRLISMQNAHLYRSMFKCLNYHLEGPFSSFGTVNKDANFKDEEPVIWKLPKTVVRITRLEHYNLEQSMKRKFKLCARIATNSVENMILILPRVREKWRQKLSLKSMGINLDNTMNFSFWSQHMKRIHLIILLFLRSHQSDSLTYFTEGAQVRFGDLFSGT